MNKYKFDPKLYALPTTQLILGTHFERRPNFMALAWATRVNFKPPLIAISVNANHISHQAIKQNGEFSLSMPSVDMVEKTDYVGLVSARKTDKSKMFKLFYGELENAPMIEECPLNLELKLFETLDLPTNSVFVGEIVGAWCNDQCTSENIPDVSKIKPFLLTMPDNRFWSFGDVVGKAWSDGKRLKEQSVT